MREKYIEERFPRYMVFGEHPTTGKVDVASVNGDIVTNVSREDAPRLIAERDKIVTFLYRLADKFDSVNRKEFTDWWYAQKV